MLRNQLKIALRILWTSPGFSSINVIGLAIGMVCSIFLLPYVSDELSYDRSRRSLTASFESSRTSHPKTEKSIKARTLVLLLAP